jgi:hypothetical protein
MLYCSYKKDACQTNDTGDFYGAERLRSPALRGFIAQRPVD